MTDINLRMLERQWRSTGNPTDGAEYLMELLRAQPVDIAAFPIEVLQVMSQMTQLTLTIRQIQNHVLLYNNSLKDLLTMIDEMMQSFFEAHFDAHNPPISAAERIAGWFESRGLSEDQALAEQQIISGDGDDDFPPYDEENEFHEMIVWFPKLEAIHVYVASQYADQYGDIEANWSSGRAEEPDLVYPMSLLREFIFVNHQSMWGLSEVNILIHRVGVWQTAQPHEVMKNIIQVQSPYTQTSVCNPMRNPYFILLDEISNTSWELSAPHIIRGRCEDYPCCGHDQCPPRWSHTGQPVGMICAECGGEMPPGPSSIHEACLRRAMRAEDPYYEDFGYYGNEHDEEDEEDEEDNEDDEEHEEDVDPEY